MDKKIKNIYFRVKQDGLTFTQPNKKLKSLKQRYNIQTFYNGRTGETVVMDREMVNRIITFYRKHNKKL